MSDASHPVPRNLGDIISANADPDGLALVELDERLGETRYTFGEIDALADAVARGLLRRGVRRGQRVAVLSANNARFLATMLGAQRAGIVLVPVNYRFPRSLSDFVIGDSGSVLVFTDAARRSQAPAGLPVVVFDGEGAESFDALLDPGPFEPVEPAPGEPAMFMYTSGSTGKPKGVVLSHQSHLWVVRTRLGGQEHPDRRYLIAAPMYHMNALALTQLALAGASSIVLLPRFEARAYIEAIDRYRPTWLTAVPPMIAMILRETEALAKADLSSVQVVRMGSAPVSEALFAAISRLLPQAQVINSYGTTEGGPVTFGPHPDGLPQPRMSVGHAHPEVAVRLVDAEGREADQGVLHIKSPGIMNGYHNRPDIRGRITEDGYYVTGDVLRRDGNGFFYFVGRDDDMFVCGGENIFPSEVEQVLETHPQIQQACVVPVPDEIKGEKPVAFVVPTPGARPDEEAIRRFALERMPAYQHPRRVWLVDALPLASTNKVDRALLKQWAIAGLARSATPEAAA